MTKTVAYNLNLGLDNVAIGVDLDHLLSGGLSVDLDAVNGGDAHANGAAENERHNRNLAHAHRGADPDGDLADVIAISLGAHHLRKWFKVSNKMRKKE